MRRVILICDVCHEQITDPNHCSPHTLQHPAHDLLGDTHFHVECCPECIEEQEDQAWREFLANEQLNESAEEMGL